MVTLDKDAKETIAAPKKNSAMVGAGFCLSWVGGDCAGSQVSFSDGRV